MASCLVALEAIHILTLMVQAYQELHIEVILTSGEEAYLVIHIVVDRIQVVKASLAEHLGILMVVIDHTLTMVVEHVLNMELVATFTAFLNFIDLHITKHVHRITQDSYSFKLLTKLCARTYLLIVKEHSIDWHTLQKMRCNRFSFWPLQLVFKPLFQLAFKLKRGRHKFVG